MIHPNQRSSSLPTRSSTRLFALLGAAGLAVGVVTSSTCARVYAAPLDITQPTDPEEEKKKNEEEAARLKKFIEEERAKLPPEPKKAPPTPVAPAPAPAPSLPTAQPTVKPPAPTPPKASGTQPPSPISGPKTQPAGGRPSPNPTPGGPPKKTPGPGSTATPNTGVPGAAGAAGGAEAASIADLPDPSLANVGDGLFHFNFTAETDITLIVQYLQWALGLQMMIQDGGALAGQKITFMTPISVPFDQAIPFVTMLLEQRDYTIIRNEMGIYVVLPKAQIGAFIGTDPSNTTQVIPTPGLKPSALQNGIAALIAANKGGAGASQPAFLDDLGIIVMTDTPRVTRIVREFVDLLVSEQKKVGYTKFPINLIAATAARERILELLGSGGGGGAGGVRISPGVPAAPGGGGFSGGFGGSLTNLPERLTIDPTTNALLFRGRPDESALLQSLLPLVDAPSQLEPRWYPVGNKVAELVTDEAKRQQLGDVTVFESSESTDRGGSGVLGGRAARGGIGGIQQPAGIQNGFGGQQQTEGSGSGFILYPEAGGFMYRGTPQQIAKVDQIIKALGPLSEINNEVVIEFYKLKHSKATDVTDVVSSLISNQAASGNRGGLLGANLGGGRGNRPASSASATDRTKEIQRRASGEQDTAGNDRFRPAGAAAGGSDSAIGDIAGDNVSVTADENNNQIVVKAPKRIQSQIKNLIDRIDLRRPQVFIEAQVIAVTKSDDFHLSVEVQQIIGQYALTTNFGLASIGDTGDILTKKIVNPGQGITTALIRSKDVPFIINAIARNNDSRIVASPQLLVDDNQEAEIESKEAQPTTTTSIGSAGQQNTQSFGGFEEAGPRLHVKPQISEGGYMRLEYEIELSSFTGEGQNGVPPPKLTNKLKSESVTVPSDTTIVVGGLNQEFRSNVVTGVPLLKDIPIIGELFKDTRIQNRAVTLYVFITPKIMRDPGFADLRLITRKPSADAAVDTSGSLVPRPEIQRIDLVDDARNDTELKLEGAIKDQKPKYDPDPYVPNKKYRRRNQGMAD